MRSSRSHNEHESKRNDYHYHSSRSQSHSESNGHGTNNNEYRTSKRTNINSGGNLLKRMKNSTLSPTETQTNNINREHVNSKISKTPSNSNNSAPSLIIDQNECHQLTYNGYLQEELEALDATNLDEKSVNDFNKFTKVTSNLKELIMKIVENKKEKLQQHNTPAKSNENLSDIKIKGLMYFMEMKSLNRMDKHRLKEARKRLSSVKDKVDQIHLQLQNIHYEVMHLQKEQKTCASFRSKDENLDLVEEKKFLISDHFPQELKHLLVVSPDKAIISLNKDIATSEELYKLHLARLDWELKQRISCDNQLKLAEESRYRLEVEITTKNQTLSQFYPTLKNIIESAKPLVSQLNVPLQVYDDSNLLTSFLPQPLYVLYVQLCAHKSAFGLDYEVNIQGSVDEAQEFELKQKNESNMYFIMNNKTEDNDEDNIQHIDDDDDELEHRGKKSRYYSHHKSPNQILENLFQPNLESNKNSSKNFDFQKKYNKLLENHPIKISLMFHYRQFKMTCIFTFFPQLQLIGLDYNIESLSFSNLLESEFSVINYESNIFSRLLSLDDTGHKCPNATVEYLLRRCGIHTYSEIIPLIGYTYDWAQRMAGIEYLNTDEKPLLSNSGIIRVKSSIAMSCLDKTIKMMILRFQARINLQEQLQEIYCKKCINTDKFMDSLNLNVNQNSISTKLKSIIYKFEKITTDQFINGIDFQQKRNLVAYFEHEDRDDCSNDIFDQNNFIFKLVLRTMIEGSEHEENIYEFHAFIIISHSYPWKWPFFILSLVSDSKNESFFLFQKWIRSLEQHVNVNLPQKVIQQTNCSNEKSYSTTLLLRQIYDLQCGLDILIEAHEKYIQKSNDESIEVYSGPRCVNSFLSTSIVQGRDHSLKLI